MSIERIETLIEKATPGPWGFESSGGDRGGYEIAPLVKDEHGDDVCDWLQEVAAVVSDEEYADHLLIAHARQLLPLMYEVLVQAESIMGNEFTTWPRDMQNAWDALLAYCSEHLPEATS